MNTRSPARIRTTRDALRGTLIHHLETHGMRRFDPETPPLRTVTKILDYGGGDLGVTIREMDGQEVTYTIKVRHQKPD